jgi:hydrogenase expression/formation protein HypD
MKHVHEFRDGESILQIAKKINSLVQGSWKIMEICGGQTHSIVKNRLEELLPGSLQLLHGPGCPVCVTSETSIDEAIELAFLKNVILVTFADMLRVPGTKISLAEARAAGARVETVYSPLDAVDIATQNSEKQIVFFAIGFETTALPNAVALLKAKAANLENFSLLVSQVLVPPAMEALMQSPSNQIQAFLAAGHVCTLMGSRAYEPLVQKYKIPIVITGFEPVDIMMGIWMCVQQLEAGEHRLEIQYRRLVKESGNEEAQRVLNECYQCCDQEWRGMGIIPQSGWRLRDKYRQFDARVRFQFVRVAGDDVVEIVKINKCKGAEVLQGKIKPTDCPYFLNECHPLKPLGAPMVSSEGACAAYATYNTGPNEAWHE